MPFGVVEFLNSVGFMFWRAQAFAPKTRTQVLELGPRD